MIEFVLIDPALSKSYIRLSDSNLQKNLIIHSESMAFWKNLDDLTKSIQGRLEDSYFFINFGPGSYTGLKQSKILAETFKDAGLKVYIYFQNDLLKLFPDYKIFITPAYKGQVYICENGNSLDLTSKLINISDLSHYVLEKKINPNEILTIKSNNESGDMISLENIYGNLNLDQLNKITKEFNDQAILYYRSPQSDYQISQND